MTKHVGPKNLRLQLDCWLLHATKHVVFNRLHYCMCYFIALNSCDLFEMHSSVALFCLLASKHVWICWLNPI